MRADAPRKVYVTQETDYDFLPAEKFGEVTFITNDDLNNTKGSLHNDKVFAQIRESIKRFDPDHDFIVIAGSPYIAAVVFTLLGRRGIRHATVLRWSNRDRIYVPLFLEFGKETIDD